jgi:pentalenene oxygenase
MTTTVAPPRRVKTAPGAFPLIGHAIRLMRDPTAFLSHLADDGDDLVRIKIGPTAAFVPCSPDSLQKVLKDDRVYDKGGVFYENARDIAGNGLVTCPFKDHRRQRRLMQSAFQRSQLAKYSEAMRAEIETSSARWACG